jgi:hypothetical protein
MFIQSILTANLDVERSAPSVLVKGRSLPLAKAFGFPLDCGHIGAGIDN